MENVLCIHRTFLSFNSNTKKIILLRISILIVLYFYVAAELTKKFFKLLFHQHFEIFLYMFTYFNLLALLSFVALTTSVYRANSFETLVSQIEHAHKFCSIGHIYRKSMQKLTKITILSLAFLVLNLVVSIMSFLFIDFSQMSKLGVLKTSKSMLLNCLIPWHEFSLFVELLIFSVFVRIVTLTLRHVNVTCKLFLEDVRSQKNNANAVRLLCHEFHKKLDEIVLVYRKLGICCYELHLCFGVQVDFTFLCVHLKYGRCL